jgi:hypothetical protein
VFNQSLADRRVNLTRRERRDVFSELLAKRFRGKGSGRNDNHRKLLGRKTLLRQIAECRHQFAFGQVSSAAEDHHDAGIPSPRRWRFHAPVPEFSSGNQLWL